VRRRKVYDEATISLGQAPYKEVIDSLAKIMISTYNIRDNPEYRSLVNAMDDTVQCLRDVTDSDVKMHLIRNATSKLEEHTPTLKLEDIHNPEGESQFAADSRESPQRRTLDPNERV